MDKIISYLSHLDGVEVGKVNASGSHYFNAQGVTIRVSDHIACSFNPMSTLNIMCDRLTDSFCVFYGNRIIPIQNYAKLREFLRNFVLVCDVLAPLAHSPKQPKVAKVEAPVNPSKHNDTNWIYIGDLKSKHQNGLRRTLANIKKVSHYA